MLMGPSADEKCVPFPGEMETVDKIDGGGLGRTGTCPFRRHLSGARRGDSQLVDSSVNRGARARHR